MHPAILFPEVENTLAPLSVDLMQNMKFSQLSLSAHVKVLVFWPGKQASTRRAGGEMGTERLLAHA